MSAVHLKTRRMIGRWSQHSKLTNQSSAHLKRADWLVGGCDDVVWSVCLHQSQAFLLQARQFNQSQTRRRALSAAHTWRKNPWSTAPCRIYDEFWCHRSVICVQVKGQIQAEEPADYRQVTWSTALQVNKPTNQSEQSVEFPSRLTWTTSSEA